MSSPHHNNRSPNDTAASFSGLLDPWPFPQDTSVDLLGLEYGSLDSSMFLEQEHVPLMVDLSILEVQGSAQQDGRDHDPTSVAEAEEPSTSGKTKKRNQKLKGLKAHEEDQVELDRNAKERARRIKLHASYLALGALLPDSRKSKKWSAPIIVDKVVEYIPELEKEIQKLTLKKENMLAAMGNDETSDQRARAHDHDEAPTVTVHPVNKREMILQICMNRRRDRDDDPCSLSSIVQKVEEQGMCIVDASSVSLCDDGVCTFHLHIQMDGSEYNAEVVREKVISWLAT